MQLQHGDLILEIIGTPQTPLAIAGATQIELWTDARVGDATLHIRLSHPNMAATALENIRAQGLTPIGARLVQPQQPLPPVLNTPKGFWQRLLRAA
jgi:hypothetical protein